MSAALWLLLRLQWGGWLRYLTRSVRTVRGAVLMLIGLAVFVPWLGTVYFGGNAGRMNPTDVAKFGPVFLLLYCLVNLLLSPDQRAVYFTPAEVQFLFAGPFTRREVLIYKIVLTLMVSVPMALIMGAVVRVRNGWLPAVLPGLLLIAVFMQLFAMAFSMLATALGASLYSRARWSAVIVLSLAAVAGILLTGQQANWDWLRLGTRLLESDGWKIASYPLQVFFDLLLVKTWSDLWLPLLMATAVNVALVLAILALDFGYQEASAASSARRYAMLQRLRGQSYSADAPIVARRNRWSLPTLPYLGGIGPVLWRQLTTAFRALGRLVIVILILLAVVTVWMSATMGRESRELFLIATVSTIGWLSLFITALVPFDFRGDLDRIALLKTLPIAPWRLSLAQLLTPVIVLTVLQWLALVALVVLLPTDRLLLLASAVVVPCFNFVLIALDNLLFLLFPTRLVASTPGDFQAVGRNVLLSMGKLMGMMVLVILALPGAVLVGVLTNSIALGLLAACPVLLLCGVGMIPLVSLAYRRFDVGRDTPA